MFCFGDEADAKTAATAAASSTLQSNDLADSALPDNEQPSQITSQAIQMLQGPSDNEHQLSTKQSSSQEDLHLTASATSQLTASTEAEQTLGSSLEEAEASASSVDTSDEDASGSDSAGERLWDMTPQQLEDLKVNWLLPLKLLFSQLHRWQDSCHM